MGFNPTGWPVLSRREPWRRTILARGQKRSLIFMAAVVLGAGAQTSDAEPPCNKNMPLLQIVNVADGFVLNTSPATAIAKCFRVAFQQDTFSDAAAAVQSRFLFEYMMAAEKVALRTTAPARAEYAEVETVGRNFIEWYGQTLDSSARQGLNKRSPERPSKILFTLHTALIKQGKPLEVLDVSESVKDYPEFFIGSRTLSTWEEYLRRYPSRFKNVDLDSTAPSVQRALENDASYKVRWKTYAEALNALEKISIMKGEARVRKQRLPPFK